MEDAELEALLVALESDRVERKESARDKERLCQAVCAFANDLPDHRKPGVIFVGVRDNATCSNLTITDDLLRELSGLRTDHQILPFPSLTVERRCLRGCEVAVVLVWPSDAPPVRYKGRVWIRTGPRRAIATLDEERRLNEKRRARDLPFDLRSFPSASLADLDLDLFRRVYLPSAVSPEILAENQRSEEAQMTSLRLLSGEPNGAPTAVGLLVLGKDPLRYLPGAYVQFLRIDGIELTDPIKDEEEIDGALPHLWPRLEDKFRAHLTVAIDPRTSPALLRPDYPLATLQQLALNALLHRSYENTNAPVRVYWFNDRIEMLSPGGPYGQVNRVNFGQPGITDYRNPHLAEAMKNLGYVQRFGVGIAIARQELARNGNPPLEFQVEDSHVLAIVRRRP